MNIDIGEIFYQQVTGTTSGHMCNIPNNPLLWTLLSTVTNSTDNFNTICKEDFVEFLEDVIKELKENKL